MVSRQTLSPGQADAAINAAMDKANAADRKVMELLAKEDAVQDDRDSFDSEEEWQAAVEAAERETAAAQDERDEAEADFQRELEFWNEDEDEDEDEVEDD